MDQNVPLYELDAVPCTAQHSGALAALRLLRSYNHFLVPPDGGHGQRRQQQPRQQRWRLHVSSVPDDERVQRRPQQLRQRQQKQSWQRRQASTNGSGWVPAGASSHELTGGGSTRNNVHNVMGPLLAALPPQPPPCLQSYCQHASPGNPSLLSTAVSCESDIRRRGEKRPIPPELKDEKYFERRRRNNQAAKKSRDARRVREDQIAWRACLLEQENASLRAHIAALRQEALALRGLLASRPEIPVPAPPPPAPSSTTPD